MSTLTLSSSLRSINSATSEEKIRQSQDSNLGQLGEKGERCLCARDRYYKTVGRDLQENLRINLDKHLFFTIQIKTMIMLELSSLLKKFHNYKSVKLCSTSARMTML